MQPNKVNEERKENDSGEVRDKHMMNTEKRADVVRREEDRVLFRNVTKRRNLNHLNVLKEVYQAFFSLSFSLFLFLSSNNLPNGTAGYLETSERDSRGKF